MPSLAVRDVALSVLRAMRMAVKQFIKGPKALGFFEKKTRIVQKNLVSHVDMSR